MLVLFAAAILTSAALLFVVQPFAAKLLLPRVGGSPAVWNACVLFFQAALLGGYAYAHLVATRLGPRAQAALHLAVVLAPAAVLPLALRGSGTPGEASPIPWVLGALALSVGAPFFALATTGPLLQRWFATTADPRGGDPYFLYAASNAGSLAGLLAYPFLIEPWLGLTTPGATRLPSGWLPLSQSTLWTAGYAAFAALAAACALVVARRPREGGATARTTASPAPGWRRRILWLTLAAVPASAMLGVTLFLTTDVAAVPLLWVVPLAAYLLSFVAAFSRRSLVPERVWSAALAVVAVAVAFSFWAFARPWVALLLVLHPLALFVLGRVLHGRLAADRPPADRLTEYYLWIAAGGVLGGAFNTLVAPALFPAVVEYPVALALACLLRPAGDTLRSGAGGRLLDVAWAAGILAVALGTAALVGRSSIESPLAIVLIQAGVPSGLALLRFRRPLGFALALSVLLAVGWVQTGTRGETLHRERTFFGVHRVVRRPSPPFSTTASDGTTRTFTVPLRTLYHGTTRHGTQAEDERLRRIPTSYYHPTGPIGQVFRVFGRNGGLGRVAVIGLGAGTLAAYGEPGRTITFYELDPAVVRIARDPRMFTFVSDSRSETAFVTGDGRLSIERAPDAAYDLVVVDAFSSDAIPVHLLTREAVDGYVRKLAPGGVLALHLTNQSFDLAKVVDAIAADRHLAGLVLADGIGSPQEILESKDPSTWAVLARDREALGPLAAADPRWERLPWAPGRPPVREHLWTDEYSNLLAVME